MSDSSGTSDYFSLFGLPRAPVLEADELARRYRDLQSKVHPDYFTGAGRLHQQLALQQASRVNDAYAALKKPLTCSAYLLSLYGADVYAETDTAMPTAFLEQQLRWREALLEAEDSAARAVLVREISTARDEVASAAVSALTALVEAGGGDTAPAYDLLRRWIYLEKLLTLAAD